MFEMARRLLGLFFCVVLLLFLCYCCFFSFLLSSFVFNVLEKGRRRETERDREIERDRKKGHREDMSLTDMTLCAVVAAKAQDILMLTAPTLASK